MSLGVLEVFVDEAGHLEHRDLTASKDRAEILVSVDHAAVLRILKTLTLDIAPQFLRDLCARHRAAADYRGEFAARLHWLHECCVWSALLPRRFPAAALPTSLLCRLPAAGSRR